jgi:hypothetical protein
MRIRAMIVGLLAAGGVAVAAQELKSIKDVMAAHKGKESMHAKIASGKGSDEDHKKLLTMYEFMATQKPPMGDEASWKAKTTEAVAAAKDVVEKKAGALDRLKKASDCKACHSVHKPK